MNGFSSKTFKNVCPANCPSSCTMISHVENSHLVHITGDPRNPYSKGYLCSKGFSYIEKNYHQDRLKFPLYQEVKGSGNLKQITWNKAFELILSEMIKINEYFGNFLPLALYKGSGNTGVHHYVTDDFFSSIGKSTRVVGSPFPTTGTKAMQYDLGAVQMTNPIMIKFASMIMIWGANPAATNNHLIPNLMEAKVKGTKIIVIDPIYTQTAEIADVYIQIVPGTDGAFANVLMQGIIEAGLIDHDFLENYSFGFDAFVESIRGIDTEEYLLNCGVPNEAIDLLLSYFKNAKSVSHIIGCGLQKHSNGGQTVRSIEALAAIRGDIGRTGGGIFFRQGESLLFKNQQSRDTKNRIVSLNQLQFSNLQPSIEMMWISCANPITQDPDSRFTKQFIKDIPFVVTVDQFLTPTAQMSNLILPTTTQFEELDIVTNSWHKAIALNEKAISPYFESISEWNIMNELAIRLNQYRDGICSFPIYSSEEEYLNAQFNEQVFELYNIRSIADLKEKPVTKYNPKVAWMDRKFATETGKYQFYSTEAKQNGLPSIPIYKEGKSPSAEYPFWLITPHHPYRLNSQFHYLDFFEEEAYIEINSEVAKNLGILDGEVIKIFNAQDTIEIIAIYSDKVPNDVLLVYQGWYPQSGVNVNQLVRISSTDMGDNGVAFYDTFVNIAKW